MALSDLTSSQLQELIRLIKEKEALEAKLARVNQKLSALGKPSPAPAAKVASKSSRSRKRRRGGLKDGIIAALKEAGKEGVSVKDLATKLNTKGGNVWAWFYSTGKKIKEIKKDGKGRFAYAA